MLYSRIPEQGHRTTKIYQIAAITKLLEKADLRKLRLIWIYVERMTRTN